MSDNELKNDQMRSSRPAIIKNICLKSEQAQKVFKKSFRQLDRHAFSISIISRARMHQQKAQAAENKISELFIQVNNDLDLHIERLQHLYKKTGIDEQVTMSNPLDVTAKITTRLSMEFLALIEKMDKFLCLFEPLVIMGKISYEQRQSVTFQWQERLVKLGTKLRLMSQEIRKWHKEQSGDAALEEYEDLDDTASRI